MVSLFKARASLSGYATTWVASEYAVTRAESAFAFCGLKWLYNGTYPFVYTAG